MIEAVENHMPEVIVIDEIGTEAESNAARTIAERGVQLIGTAHGINLENILMNPTLSDLVGGINAVTLSDDEARRRGTRKTVLERKAPPTFDILIEILDRDKLAIHHSVSDTVDAILRGFAPPTEVRQRVPGGGVTVVQESNPVPIRRATAFENEMSAALAAMPPNQRDEDESNESSVSIFPYGVSRNKIQRAISNLGVNAHIARKWDEADVVMTLKALERKESEKLRAIAAENIPIYSIKTNTTTQVQNALKDVFNLPPLDVEEIALREAGEAIHRVLLHHDPVELTPQSSYVRRLQHQLAEQYNVQSRSTGLEPNRRVRIFRGRRAPSTESRRSRTSATLCPAFS